MVMTLNCYSWISQCVIPLTKGVQLDEASTPIKNQWDQDLEEFVRQLSSPNLCLNNRAESREQKSEMRLPVSELSLEMREKNTVTCGKRHDKIIPSALKKQNMDKKSCSSGKINSIDSDEAVELSFESTSSSTGQKECKVTFTCDSNSSPDETSDFDFTSDTKSTDSKTISVKKDKESKRRRFKRMITRPLRRSQSAGCAKDIPSHALFVGSENDNDTMESRAVELSLYHQRLLGVPNEEVAREQTRKVHKTCSADAAMMAKSEFMGEGSPPKTKSKGFKNMKRKFQFLRRRHTDTSLVPKFSLPHHFSITSHDQALQWSKSFDSLLNDKSGLELFKGFLKSEFSEENLEFWIACEEFRFSKDTNLSAQAQKIYGEFVAFQAPKEVNLDSNTRLTTVTNLEHPTRETFQVAQHKIQALMEKDSYQRFIESELYQQILESLNKS